MSKAEALELFFADSLLPAYYQSPEQMFVYSDMISMVFRTMANGEPGQPIRLDIHGYCCDSEFYVYIVTWRKSRSWKVSSDITLHTKPHLWPTNETLLSFKLVGNWYADPCGKQHMACSTECAEYIETLIGRDVFSQPYQYVVRVTAFRAKLQAFYNSAVSRSGYLSENIIFKDVTTNYSALQQGELPTEFCDQSDPVSCENGDPGWYVKIVSPETFTNIPPFRVSPPLGFPGEDSALAEYAASLLADAILDLLIEKIPTLASRWITTAWAVAFLRLVFAELGEAIEIEMTFCPGVPEPQGEGVLYQYADGSNFPSNWDAPCLSYIHTETQSGVIEDYLYDGNWSLINMIDPSGTVEGKYLYQFGQQYPTVLDPDRIFTIDSYVISKEGNCPDIFPEFIIKDNCGTTFASARPLFRENSSGIFYDSLLFSEEPVRIPGAKVLNAVLNVHDRPFAYQVGDVSLPQAPFVSGIRIPFPIFNTPTNTYFYYEDVFVGPGYTQDGCDTQPVTGYWYVTISLTSKSGVPAGTAYMSFNIVGTEDSVITVETDGSDPILYVYIDGALQGPIGVSASTYTFYNVDVADIHFRF